MTGTVKEVGHFQAKIQAHDQWGSILVCRPYDVEGRSFSGLHVGQVVEFKAMAGEAREVRPARQGVKA